MHPLAEAEAESRQRFGLESPAPHIPKTDSVFNIAAPATSAESVPRIPDLRRQLADAIEARHKADERARAAAEIAARADAAKIEAAMAAEQLKQDLDAAGAAAIQAHAAALTAAFRAGEAPPATPTPAPADSAALGLALARLNALHQSACELAAELDAARGEAAKAAAHIAALVDQIMFAEINGLAAEAIAAAELHWQLMDRLNGLILIDERRPRGPTLRAFQDALIKRIDRRKAAIAADPILIEQHAFNRHLDDLAAGQERAWLDYARRLASDASATFEAREESTQ